MSAVLWIVAVVATLFAAERILKMAEMVGEPLVGLTSSIAGPAAASYTLVAIVAATAAIILGRRSERGSAHRTEGTTGGACICHACGAQVEPWHRQCPLCGTSEVRPAA
jgi:type IV secretory pathway VirB2 component (pilin)